LLKKTPTLYVDAIRIQCELAGIVEGGILAYQGRTQISPRQLHYAARAELVGENRVAIHRYSRSVEGHLVGYQLRAIEQQAA
jgi:hypothetical protein